jgi:RNA polymerase-binding transcription factor DksA
MGDVVKLFRGRVKSGKRIPKPVECKDCGDDIETARLQALNDGLAVTRCISCARAHEKRFNRQMDAVRHWQTVQIIR